MNYLHLIEDETGTSHFVEGTIDLAMGDFAPPAPPMWISKTNPAAAFLFLTLPVGWGGTKHPSPRRQIAFCLSGQLEVEAGDGEVRAIRPGGIWRMEDVTGSGHITTVIGAEEVLLAVVQLD